METDRTLLVFGTVLLTLSALSGFVQHVHRHAAEAFARWRVVHAGGTAGAVQLLALSAIWQRLSLHETWTALLAWGLVFAACTFFVGPLARAMGRPRLARVVERAGAAVAVPAYLALPAILLR